MKRALFIFRRDLRLEDNRGLLFALEKAEEVILAFIFTPEQIEHNLYRGDRCLQFMIESLEDLEKACLAKKGKLFLFYGEHERVIGECIDKLGVDGVVVNRDYTPYSKHRDGQIGAFCKKRGVRFYCVDDLLLHPILETAKKDGKPYTIFTPFYRNALKLEVAMPERNESTHYFGGSVPFAADSSIYKKILPKRFKQAPGGRMACLEILKNLKNFSHYPEERDFPAIDRTTHLSAHLKFTTCSTREVYHAMANCLGRDAELIRSLYWRDFFTLIGFHFPHVFGGCFKREYDSLEWGNNVEKFTRWCEGKTGFPIVDAGMRELNETGFMHNRVRMITASFLVKDLHLDWRWGEKYFAQHLIDYDPAVNNGNWQWSASTGCDAQPYFRIFNPWAQGKKFDPDCVYIKRWIPELKTVSSAAIHEWYVESRVSDYPRPMVDHSKEAKHALESYKLSIIKK